MVYSGAFGQLFSLGHGGRRRVAPCFCLVLEGRGKGVELLHLPLENIFQKNSKNLKISLGNWEKSGYNRME